MGAKIPVGAAASSWSRVPKSGARANRSISSTRLRGIAPPSDTRARSQIVCDRFECFGLRKILIGRCDSIHQPIAITVGEIRRNPGCRGQYPHRSSPSIERAQFKFKRDFVEVEA
jgi:hypothetical protein